MNHNVNPALEHLLVPIEKLRHLPGNPRKGDVASIVESYKTFGQVRPVIAVPGEEEDTFIVIAGNHQLDACIALEWTHMAVLIKEDWDEAKALAFALADNRTSELGKTDDELLFEMLTQIDEEHEELMQALQWDPFEMALLESTYEAAQVQDAKPTEKGWTPPMLIDPEEAKEDEVLDADEGTTEDVVTQGAGIVNRAGSERQSFNYTLVFPEIVLQKRFFDFLRYLKGEADPELTTGEQLIEFLERNHEF